MKKIVSLIVVLCFMVSNVSFATSLRPDIIPTGGTNLQVPFLLNNILDESEIAKEPVNIRLWFMACLRTMASEGFDFKSATPVEILDQLKEFGDEQNGEIFNPEETQFFIHEASVYGSLMNVMVRINKDNSLRTYDVNFTDPESVNVSLRRDSKECLPAEGILENMGSLAEFLKGIVVFDVDKEKVNLVEGKEEEFIERLPVLVYNIAVNSNDSVKDAIEWIILELGPQLPVNTAIPASGQVLYRGIGEKYYKKSAILKINQRALIPYLYRIMLKVMREQNVVAMSQIAISEAIYIVGGDTQKSPAVNLAQAILAGVGSEGVTPVFNSRDHLQIDKKAYDEDAVAALRSRADTIRDDVLNGKIYSIDLDTSTIALTPDEAPGDVTAQQRPNFEAAVRLTIFARLLETIYNVPSIALNGEVGEVGTEVVTTEELRAYLEGYEEKLEAFKKITSEQKLRWIKEENGIFGFTDEEMSKVEQVLQKEVVDFHGLEAMSCQVGSKHGGVKVPGKPWKRTGNPVVNMKRLEELAEICREHELAGLIVHGASSISEEELAEIVKRGAIAVHLATYIHDRIFSHPKFPTELVSKLFTLLRAKNQKLLNKPIDDYTPDVKIGDIVAGIEKTVNAKKPLNEEQREQVAWIVHTARGKGTSKEQHDKGEGVWSFIDLEEDMMALPKETLAQLNKVVEEQILRYVELLNAKDTGDIIKGVEFPTPPSAPMPDTLKGHIINPPESDTSKEEVEINDMEAVASKAGLEMPTHLDTRYTFLVTDEFFADNDEFRSHQADSRFKDRFNIDRVSGKTSDQFVENVLAKAKDPDRTVALVPNHLSTEQLEKLTNVGIRVVRTNTMILLGTRNVNEPNRGQFQLDTYATMFAVRRMDGSVSKGSSVYRTLSFYIRSHFDLSDNIEVEQYIQAVVDGTVAVLIEGYLAYRPAEPYVTPSYGTVAAALISA